MSLPDEKIRAMISSRQFLFDLLDPKKTPRVPKAVRLQARRLCKHWPFPFEIEEMMEVYNAYRVRNDVPEADS